MKQVIFENTALDDIRKLAQVNPKLLKKVFELIDDIIKHPFEGLGKPELLKHNLKGYWSRRITDEHRLIYKIDADQNVVITALVGHYA
jgi:toxin YoeB